MNMVLRGAVENGTGNAARLYGREVAGKTGTTSDYTDARFVGYTTDLVTSVWLGFDDPEKKLVGVRGYDGVSGGTLPAQIWHDFMDGATRNRPNEPFVQPADLGGQVLNPTTTAPPVTVPPTTQPGQPNPQPTFPSPTQPGPSLPPPSLTLPGPGPPRPGLGGPGGMRAATAAGGTRRGPVWARAGGRERAAGGTVDLLVVGLWLLTRVVLLVVSLNPRLYSAALFGDIRFYGAKVERMFQGELPYRDVATEYPPGSVPFTILPGLVVGTGGGYRLAFACEMLLVDAVGLWAATRLARVGRRRAPAHPPGLRAGHGGRRAPAGAPLRHRPGGVRAAGGGDGRRGPVRLGGRRPRLRHRGQDLPRRAGPAAGPRAGAGARVAAVVRPDGAAVPGRLRPDRGAGARSCRPGGRPTRCCTTCSGGCRSRASGPT